MKALKLIINKKFRPDMLPEELYEASRGDWDISEEKMDAQYALIVGDGKVRELYKINMWNPVPHKQKRRWRFDGEIAEESLRRECVGKRKRNLQGDANSVDLIDLDVFRHFGHGIEKEHVIQAFHYIDYNGEVGDYNIRYAFRPAKKKSVIYNGVQYAAKEVMRIAYCYKIGEKPDGDHRKFSERQWRLFNRSSEKWTTNMSLDFLHKMGFEVFFVPESDPIDMQKESRAKSWQLELLEQFNQIIFHGPPGTGKTRAAKQILDELFGEDEVDDLKGDRWDIVQFHPSYNYEDFVRGIKVKTENGKVTYEPVNRTFGKICNYALDNPNEKYVLIIDEINRANVSAVLGELIYALEYRGERVKTPYLGDIIIPPNLYVIGTMNTADRTIGQIDYAVRRRFAFVHCPPKKDIITDDEAKKHFSLINKMIDKHISSDFDAKDVHIGHSYFLKSGKELDNIINYQILPILREYVKDGVLQGSATDIIDEIREPEEQSSDDDSEYPDSSPFDLDNNSSGGSIRNDSVSGASYRIVNINDGDQRLWRHCHEFKFVSAGGKKRYLTETAKLRQGDFLFVCRVGDDVPRDQRGCVAYCKVISEHAIDVREIQTERGKLGDVQLDDGQTYSQKFCDGREFPDKAVKVEWINVMENSFVKITGSHRTFCTSKINDSDFETLANAFGISGVNSNE